MPISEISRLDVSAFRCLPNEVVGDFGAFNLIYGPNGSGKTSLFEAIELAFTGASSRHMGSDRIEEAVSREDGNAHVTVYDPKNRVIGEFKNGRLCPGPKEMIQKMYGVEASGIKARTLLPRLFSVHNVLFSEAIMSFLSAENKGDLHKALLELTTDAHTLRVWRKLSEARTQARSIRRESEAHVKTLSATEFRLRELLANLSSKSENSIIERGNRLFYRLPPDFVDGEGPATANTATEFLRRASIAQDRLREVLLAVEQLTESGKIVDGTSSKTLEEEKSRLANFAAGTRSQLDETRREEGTVVARIADLEKAVDLERSRCTQLAFDKKRLLSSSSTIIELLQWLPEFHARNREQAFDTLGDGLERLMRRWEQVASACMKLPSTEVVLALQEQISTLRAKRESMQEVVASNFARVSDLKRHLDKIESEIREKNQASDSIQSEVHHLIGVTTAFVAAHPPKDCPLCGHAWKSEAELAQAIERTSKELLERVGAPSDDHLRLVDSKEAASFSLAAAQTEHRESSKGLDDLDSKIVLVEGELSRSLEYASQMRRLLDDLQPKIETIPIDVNSNLDQFPGLDISRVREELATMRARLESTRSQALSIWNGLRKDLFRSVEGDLDARLADLRGSSANFGFSLPEVITADSLVAGQMKVRAHQATVADSLSAAEENVQKGEIDLQNLRNRLGRLRNAASQAKEVSDKCQREIGDFDQVLAHVETLISGGLVKPGGSIDLASLRVELSAVLNEMKVFAHDCHEHLMQLEEASAVRAEHRFAQDELSSATNFLDSATLLEQRISALRSPEDTEKVGLLAIEGQVSDVFRSLHWPFDFQGVSFGENTPLEIFVTPRFGTVDQVPAHLWLSGGQRAALAISIFWSMNLSQVEIPQIMLMDEPVQNIDELNALNFLDSLRWIVEGRKRQVFLSTSSRRLAGLVRKKFAYLGPRFVEIELARSGAVSEIEIHRHDGRGHRFATG